MKPDSGIITWSEKVKEAAKKYPRYVKVSNVIEDMDEIYPEFKEMSNMYKKSLVGKCLTRDGLVKYSTGNQGCVYRRPDEITS